MNVGQLEAIARRVESPASDLLAFLDRGLDLERRKPGRWLVWSALGAELSAFLWLPLGVAVSWAVALPPALLVAGVLALDVAGSASGHRDQRSRPVAAALGMAMVLSILLAAFLALLLLLIMAQGAMSGKGILPFLILILIFTFAVYAEVGLPLFLALTLVLILDMGVLMDSGPVANLAIPLLMAMGPIVVLFYTISRSPRHTLLQLPGSGKHPGQID